MNKLDLALVIGASARLTRFVITDDLGETLVRLPVENLLDRIDNPVLTEERLTQRQRFVRAISEGLDCPYCVGFWLGAGVLASEVLTRNRLTTRAAWRFVAGSLALNYVVGHLFELLDSGGESDD